MIHPHDPEQSTRWERLGRIVNRLLGRRRFGYRQALQTFSRELATIPLDLQAILERLIAQVEPVTCDDAVRRPAPVLVFLYDSQTRRYTLQQGNGSVAARDQDISFRQDSDLVRWLGGQDRPIYLPGEGGQLLRHKLSTEERKKVEAWGLVLFLPLWGRAQLTGWVALGPRVSGKPYSPDDMAFLAALADQATIAIENARLHEGIKQANKAKSEFIDFVAHELKQPMTVMQGYAKMLATGMGGELNDTQAYFIQIINSNVERMGKLINDLLEISRLEAGRIKLNLAPVHLHQVVDETIIHSRTEIEARQHTVDVDVPDDLPPVVADQERLVQILTNLLSNACKYTPAGGTIRITANGHDQTKAPPGHLLVSVSDTGIGMSPQDLARLEEKFFRADQPLVREQPGTGLGISITRNLVALHGGEFMVESEPGRGSTFRFTVPLADVRDESRIPDNEQQ